MTIRSIIPDCVRTCRAALTGMAMLALGACGAGGPELSPVITLAESGASNPTVAVAPDGSAHWIAWVSQEGPSSNVWIVRVPAEGAPESAVRVNDVPGDAAPHLQAPAQVAAGAVGELYVLWQNNTVIEGRPFPASDLRFARSLDGGRSFEPAITVNDDPPGSAPGSHTFHNLVVGPSGEVIVSWLESSGGGREMAMPGGTAPAAGHAGHAMPESGGSSEVGPDLRVAVSRDGGRTFGSSSLVDENTCPCCRTDLVVGPDGEIYVGWRKVFEGNTRDIVVARSDDGGANWSDPMRVHEDGWEFDGCPHAGPGLEVDEKGTLHVGWYTGKEGFPGLYYAQSLDRGATFSDPQEILVADWVPPSQIEILASGGAIWMAWEDRVAPEGAIHVSRAPSSEPRVGRATLVLRGSNPSLAGDGPRVVLAWLDGDAVRAKVGPG